LEWLDLEIAAAWREAARDLGTLSHLILPAFRASFATAAARPPQSLIRKSKFLPW